MNVKGKHYQTTGCMKGLSPRDFEEIKYLFRFFTFDFSVVFFTDYSFTELSDGEVSFTADGPSGNFCDLMEVDFFRRMAKTCPDMYMEADVVETDNHFCYTTELHCRLAGGILISETRTVTEETNGYVNYIVRELPCGKFMELFAVEPGTLTEDDYAHFVSRLLDCCDDSLFDPDLELFRRMLGNYGGKTALDWKSYGAACEKAYRGLLTMSEFSEQSSVIETETSRFDAKAGEYIS